MNEREAVQLLISAIEDIQLNWESGDLATMVRHAIEIKDEICQGLGFPTTEEILSEHKAETRV
jgi:hypothetical protein